MTQPGVEWWRHAVVYQIYPRSFADSDGDGMGDLPGIVARLPELADLGVDAIWLSPFYRSPMNDAGYDVADFRQVDPLFGTLDDADALIIEAHRLGVRVLVDLVPNHTSSEHAWFQAALASPPGSPERARYVFRPGRGPDGAEPPNNWRSQFGGTAWTRVTEADGHPGEWYLHLFDPSQPDLDWSNREVRDEVLSVMRFWLDRGVDGFRVDVAHSLVKSADLGDWHYPEDETTTSFPAEEAEPGHRAPMWDQEGVHDIYREWRRLLDSYDGQRMAVAEAWVTPYSRLARYARPDELHQAFNFVYLETPWRAADQHEAITGSLRESGRHGAPVAWVLSNHDVVRHASRFGYSPDQLPIGDSGISARDPQPDAEAGLRRARAATLLMLALPGTAYLFLGEELGLPEHTTLPDAVRQDPSFRHSEGAKAGRDGCRVPIPWSGEAPSYGFGPGAASWLPQPTTWAELARDRQRGVPGSTLELYRAALRLRRGHGLGLGELAWADGGTGGDGAAIGVTYDPATSVAFLRTDADGQRVLVLANLGPEPVPLPEGADVLVASAGLDEVDGQVAVGTDVTAWAILPD